MISKPSRIALIAGHGLMPVEAFHSATAQGHHVHVIGIDGEADAAAFPEERFEWIRWGQIGHLFKRLKTIEAEHVVILGAIRQRPDFLRMRLDLGAITSLPRILAIATAGGDESVLSGIARYFADKGHTLTGVHEIAPDLLLKDGMTIGKVGKHARDTLRALWAARFNGLMDMGQGAVVVRNRIVACEGSEGTDGMLSRVAELKKVGRIYRKGQTGVLAKVTRPDQDLRMDLPTVGPNTLQHIADANMAGCVLEAGRVLIAERERFEAMARKLNLFVTAMQAPELKLKGDAIEAFAPYGYPLGDELQYGTEDDA